MGCINIYEYQMSKHTHTHSIITNNTTYIEIDIWDVSNERCYCERVRALNNRHPIRIKIYFVPIVVKLFL